MDKVVGMLVTGNVVKSMERGLSLAKMEIDMLVTGRMETSQVMVCFITAMVDKKIKLILNDSNLI